MFEPGNSILAWNEDHSKTFFARPELANQNAYFSKEMFGN